jgi:polyhydroxyalkanoate synthesis regulator phasin
MEECMENQTSQTEPNGKGQNAEKSVRSSLYETTRLILLAGVGAVTLAQEEVNSFLDRLVERGEMAEQDARKLVREVMDKREKLEQEHRQRAEARRAPKATASKADIEALSLRVAELTRQIEELRQQQANRQGE